MAKKISYENWWSSARKWVKIVEKVKRQEKFILDDDCFVDLSVAGACGYCEEYRPCNTSTLCPLFLKSIQGIRVCFSYYLGSIKTHFQYFILEMREDNPDFKSALCHSKIILNAILEDCPNKKRATKDGIVFE